MQTQNQPLRAGESYCSYDRSGRCAHVAGKWISKTREGRVMGPFRDRCSAELASAHLVEYLRLAPPRLNRALRSHLSMA